MFSQDGLALDQCTGIWEMPELRHRVSGRRAPLQQPPTALLCSGRLLQWVRDRQPALSSCISSRMRTASDLLFYRGSSIKIASAFSNVALLLCGGFAGTTMVFESVCGVTIQLLCTPRNIQLTSLLDTLSPANVKMK